MKKLLLSVAVVCIALFTSCETERPDNEENEPLKSLAGTTWRLYLEDDIGSWSEYTLNFTSTEATYTKTNSANNNSNFTGRYTYDPPIVIIYSDRLTLTGNEPTGTFIFPQEIPHEGTVDDGGKTMTVGICSFDEVCEIDFERLYQ